MIDDVLGWWWHKPRLLRAPTTAPYTHSLTSPATRRSAALMEEAHVAAAGPGAQQQAFESAREVLLWTCCQCLPPSAQMLTATTPQCVNDGRCAHARCQDCRLERVASRPRRRTGSKWARPNGSYSRDPSAENAALQDVRPEALAEAAEPPPPHHPLSGATSLGPNPSPADYLDTTPGSGLMSHLRFHQTSSSSTPQSLIFDAGAGSLGTSAAVTPLAPLDSSIHFASIFESLSAADNPPLISSHTQLGDNTVPDHLSPDPRSVADYHSAALHQGTAQGYNVPQTSILESPSTADFLPPFRPHAELGDEHSKGHGQPDFNPSAVTIRHIAALHQSRDQAHAPQASHSTTSIGLHDTPQPSSVPPPCSTPKPQSTVAASRKRARANTATSHPAPTTPKVRAVKHPPTKKTKHQSPGHLFTCPFVWHDPSQYRSCLKLDLKRIRDVKQHLRRKHMRPCYCFRCNGIFATDAEVTAHLQRSVACLPCTGGGVPEGIMQTEVDNMSKYPETKMDLVAQWNRIWDTIFPHRCDTRPVSPFVDARLSEDIRALVIFSQSPAARQGLQGNPYLQSHDIDLGLCMLPMVVEVWVATHTGATLSYPALPVEFGSTSIIATTSAEALSG